MVVLTSRHQFLILVLFIFYICFSSYSHSAEQDLCRSVPLIRGREDNIVSAPQSPSYSTDTAAIVCVYPISSSVYSRSKRLLFYAVAWMEAALL